MLVTSLRDLVCREQKLAGPWSLVLTSRLSRGLTTWTQSEKASTAKTAFLWEKPKATDNAALSSPQENPCCPLSLRTRWRVQSYFDFAPSSGTGYPSDPSKLTYHPPTQSLPNPEWCSSADLTILESVELFPNSHFSHWRKPQSLAWDSWSKHLPVLSHLLPVLRHAWIVCLTIPQWMFCTCCFWSAQSLRFLHLLRKNCSFFGSYFWAVSLDAQASLVCPPLSSHDSLYDSLYPVFYWTTWHSFPCLGRSLIGLARHHWAPCPHTVWDAQ